jgi:hypothetical protein
MERGDCVNYNDGERQVLSLVRKDKGGENLNLIALTKDGIRYVDDVPRRDKADYGPEGGGHTWNPVE